MSKDKSAPAFPVAEDHRIASDLPWTSGMTLRDYFAASALSGWIQSLGSRYGYPGYSDEGALAQAVRLSLETADAMLEEREK